jgi:hypothetical protein
MEGNARFGSKADVSRSASMSASMTATRRSRRTCLGSRLQSVLGTRREWPGEIAGLTADTEKPGEVLENPRLEHFERPAADGRASLIHTLEADS